jgi:hypothetical protein
MKSEHRHELQQNDLGKLTQKVTPWVERHGLQVLAGVVVVLVLGGGVLWWTSQAVTAGSAGWTQLATAQTVEDYAAVVEQHGDSLAGAWARLRGAELNLETGIQAAFTDREAADLDLKRAKEDFEKVLAAKVTLPAPVKERAMLGLARTLEATCDGNTAPVVEAYQSLLKQFPDSVYKTHVDQRVKELQSASAGEFYKWFHAQQPKPPEFTKPKDGAGKASSLPGEFELPPPASVNPGESTSADAPK